MQYKKKHTHKQNPNIPHVFELFYGQTKQFGFFVVKKIFITLMAKLLLLLIPTILPPRKHILFH